MKSFKYIILGTALLISFVSCTKEQDPGEIGKATSGAYMRDINISSNTFSLSNFGNSYFEIMIEEWDIKKGDLFDSYVYNVEFIDNTTSNGTVTKPIAVVKSVPKSAFTRTSDRGLLRTTVRITASEVMTALGLAPGDVAVGDQFRFVEDLHLNDGRIFNVYNTSPAIAGSTFFNAPMVHYVDVVN
jgi:hypothetical protein